MAIQKIDAAFSRMEDGVLTYYITGFIDEFLFDNFVDNLNFREPESVKIVFFSPGGSILTAFAMYDYIRTQLNIPIRGQLFGYCASAATIIASAIKNIEMAPNAYWMMHYAFQPGGTLTKEMEETLDDVIARMISIYMEKSGLSKNKIIKLMDEGEQGKLINSDDAIKLGFVSSLIEELEAIAAHSNIFGKLKIDNNMQNKFVEKLLGILGLEKIEEIKDVDATMDLLKEKLSPQNNADLETLQASLTTVIDQVKAFETNQVKQEEFQALQAGLTSLKEEFDPKFLAIDEALKQIPDLQKKIEDLSIETELADIKAELVKLAATSSAAGEPVPTGAIIPKSKDVNAETVVSKSGFMDKFLTGQII